MDQRTALIQARLGFLICLGATTLATFSWINQNYYLWGVNCAVLTAAAVVTLINYRIADH